VVHTPAYYTIVTQRAPHEAVRAVLGGSTARARFRQYGNLPNNNLQNAPKGALLLTSPSSLLTIYPPLYI
jgi:hypothetical protein